MGRDRRIDVAGEHRRAVECAGELVDDLARDDLAFLVLALAGLHRVVDQRLDGDHLAGSGRLRDFHAGLGRCHCFRSEEHTSELQSLMRISYAVFCLKKKKTKKQTTTLTCTTNVENVRNASQK